MTFKNNDFQCDFIEVVGERHTGTNYLEQLLLLNTECSIMRNTAHSVISKLPRFAKEQAIDLYFKLASASNIKWKHRALSQDDARDRLKFNCGIICLVKDPLSWIVSLKRKPYHSKWMHENFEGSLYEFACSPWQCRTREFVNKKVNVAELYQHKVESYLNLKHCKNLIIIRYEDLVLHKKDTLDLIIEKFNVIKKQTPFQDLNQSTKSKRNNYDSRSADDFVFNIVQKTWLEEYEGDAISKVLGLFDKALLEKLGYPY